MVTVDSLGVEVIEPIESWLVMRDKVGGVDGPLDCVSPCGWDWMTGGANAGGRGEDGGGGGGC